MQGPAMMTQHVKGGAWGLKTLLPRHQRPTMLCLLIAFCLLGPVIGQDYPQPEQVHLSLGDSVDEIVVTWVTLNSVKRSSIVEYGSGSYQYRAFGKQTVFVDGGREKRHLYMHRVKLTNLSPETRYVYHVGGPDGWSDQFSFKTMPTHSNWSPRFAMYGDMGNKNARSLPRLQEETQSGNFDMILHVGDFAYNMDWHNARTGDEFMRQIEPIAAYVPYMTCAGNHEAAYNFSNYKARFTMPGGDGQNQFYSFNVGPVHFIYFDLEFYYYVNFGWHQIPVQYRWLEKDLEEANRPENRRKRPWIIALSHRPMYCTNSDDREHCPNPRNIARIGRITPFSKTNKFGLEDLFYKYGVDVIVGAHEHSYERMFPVYNLTVCKGRTSPYVNPRAPVHIVSGSAGCLEHPDPFIHHEMPWSAFHSSDYGYTRVHVVNSTHMYFEQMSDNQGRIIDRTWIVQTQHGAGRFDCHLDNNLFNFRDGRFGQVPHL